MAHDGPANQPAPPAGGQGLPPPAPGYPPPSAAPPSPSPPPANNQATAGLLAFLGVSVVIFAAGAIVVQFQDVDPAIQAALWGLAATSILWVGAALAWGAINPGNTAEPAL